MNQISSSIEIIEARILETKEEVVNQISSSIEIIEGRILGEGIETKV